MQSRFNRLKSNHMEKILIGSALADRSFLHFLLRLVHVSEQQPGLARRERENQMGSSRKRVSKARRFNSKSGQHRERIYAKHEADVLEEVTKKHARKWDKFMSTMPMI